MLSEIRFTILGLKVSDIVSMVLFCIISLALMASHLDAKPAQSIMTAMVWLLPVIYCIRFPRNYGSGALLLMYSSIILFISAFLSYSLSDDIWGTEVFRSYWLYLLPIGVIPVIVTVSITRHWLVNILILCSILSFVVVLKDISSGDVRGNRHGLPIPYGTISLTTALLCLIFSFDDSIFKVKRLILFFSFILAAVGVVWSQTRGAWLYFLIWSVIASFLWFKNERSMKKRVVVLIVIVSSSSLFFLLPAGKLVGERVSGAVNEIEIYLEDNSRRTSSGQRLDLWLVSANSFFENPWVGSGFSGFLEKRDEMIQNQRVHMSEALHHSHNDILWAATTRGLLGVLALIFMYMSLGIYYLRILKDTSLRIYGIAGLTVVGGAVVYGITDIYMSLKITIGYFFIINSLLIGVIEKSRGGSGF